MDRDVRYFFIRANGGTSHPSPHDHTPSSRRGSEKEEWVGESVRGGGRENLRLWCLARPLSHCNIERDFTKYSHR